MTGSSRLYAVAKDAAAKFHRELLNRLRLQGTVGIATSKLVSKIAAKIAKERICNVVPGDEAAFLAPLPVFYLPGVGKVRQQVLFEELNIRIIRQVREITVGHLKLVFGHFAYQLHQLSTGVDPTPVALPQHQPAITEEETLIEDDNDDTKVLGVISKLLERASSKLRRQRMMANRLELMIRYSDLVEAKSEICIDPPSCWEWEIYPLLEQLYGRICSRRVRIRTVRMVLRQLIVVSNQLSLFSVERRIDDKQRNLRLAIDDIREKFGEAQVQLGR